VAFAFHAPSAVVNAMVPFIQPAQVHRPKYTFQVPQVSGSSPTGGAAKMCETFTHRVFQRIPPLIETRRTSKCSG
jgi:hypothetical protein